MKEIRMNSKKLTSLIGIIFIIVSFVIPAARAKIEISIQQSKRAASNKTLQINDATKVMLGVWVGEMSGKHCGLFRH